jgi:hypothetical protein
MRSLILAALLASGAISVLGIAGVAAQPVQAQAAPVGVGQGPSVMGPSVMGPSAAASAAGPGFAVIANPVGAAASAAQPTDAGAPTDPRMR